MGDSDKNHIEAMREYSKTMECLHSREADFAAAEEHFRNFVRLDPDNYNVFEKLFNYYSRLADATRLEDFCHEVMESDLFEAIRKHPSFDKKDIHFAMNPLTVEKFRNGENTGEHLLIMGDSLRDKKEVFKSSLPGAGVTAFIMDGDKVTELERINKLRTNTPPEKTIAFVWVHGTVDDDMHKMAVKSNQPLVQTANILGQLSHRFKTVVVASCSIEKALDDMQNNPQLLRKGSKIVLLGGSGEIYTDIDEKAVEMLLGDGPLHHKLANFITRFPRSVHIIKRSEGITVQTIVNIDNLLNVLSSSKPEDARTVIEKYIASGLSNLGKEGQCISDFGLKQYADQLVSKIASRGATGAVMPVLRSGIDINFDGLHRLPTGYDGDPPRSLNFAYEVAVGYGHHEPAGLFLAHGVEAPALMSGSDSNRLALEAARDLGVNIGEETCPEHLISAEKSEENYLGQFSLPLLCLTSFVCWAAGKVFDRVTGNRGIPQHRDRVVTGDPGDGFRMR